MELFRKIADNTEEKLVIIIKKKTVDKEVFLTVVVQQDKQLPLSFRGKPELLDTSFEEDYTKAVARLKETKPEDKADNVEEVVTEKKKEEEEAKETKLKNETKTAAAAKAKGDAKKKDPVVDVKNKIDKLKKSDKENIEKIIKSISTSKDADVRNFSINELKRRMSELKFTTEEYETIVGSVQNATSVNSKKEESKTEDTGMFAKEEAGMVDVTEETANELVDEPTQEAPWEEPDEPKTKQEEAKAEPKKESKAKTAAKKEEVKKEEAVSKKAPESPEEELLF